MAQCQACGKEIYFLKTQKGKFIPVNADSMTEMEIADCRSGMKRIFQYGKHITHFSNCPKADSFRRGE